MLIANENINTLENLNENNVSNETIQEETSTNEITQTDSNIYDENEKATSLIRLSNFTKQINYKDLTFTFNQFKLASQGIHIPICYDNKSKLFNIGYCYNLVFIEFINDEEAKKAFNNKILRNKLRFFFGDDLHIQYASKNELIQLLFPTYFCKFNDSLQKNIDYESLIPDNENILFIDFSEMEILTNICQKPDVNSNFKSEERPFNFVISLCTYYPWNKSNKNFNNKIFNFYKNIILILNQHIEEKKFSNKLSKALLAKMVKIAVECPGFTNTQKRAIIKKYDNVDNYKEMMFKKESTESEKRSFENSSLENTTNTTTTPVNTTDDTSNNNINDDSSNKTVDGDEQYGDENKIEESNSSTNQYKNSFNQENGLSIEISADSDLSDNEDNVDSCSNILSADRLTMGNENGQNYDVNDSNNEIIDYINKISYSNYGYSIPSVPPPSLGKYYSVYGNYDQNNYYRYGNYDYNNYDKNGNYLTCEKLENRMRYDKRYNNNKWNNNVINNNNKYNQKLSSNKVNNQENSDFNNNNNNNNNKYKQNEKWGRPKVKNYPDIPIQLARSMVNKTPDCNELFREYCGILDSWYRQKLSKEIDMRVEQKLKEMNYNRTKGDKIIKLLENLQVEPLFDSNEDIETKLFKLVAEILRLQSIERTFSEYKNNSIDSFKSEINRLTENISNIYQIMNVKNTQTNLVNLSDQLNSISQFSNFNSKDKNYDSSTENIQDSILNAFNCGSNNTNNNNNIRKLKVDNKRENNFNYNNNCNINNTNNNNEKERKGRNNFGMNNNYISKSFNYNNIGNNNKNGSNKRFSFSNNSSVNNINRNSMKRENSNDFHRSNKSNYNNLMEKVPFNNLYPNQNQSNNFTPGKVNKSGNVSINSQINNNQDKINYKNGRIIVNNNNSSNSRLNKILSNNRSNDTLTQEGSRTLYSSSDTLNNNDDILNSSNDNTSVSNCESLESCTTKETYVNGQENISKITNTTLKSDKESLEKTPDNDLNNIIKDIILNKPRTHEIENSN